MTTTMLTRLEIALECIDALIGACEDQRETIDEEIFFKIHVDESPTDIFINKLNAVRESTQAAYDSQPTVAERVNNEDGS
jgi:hypothetical protein